MTDFKYWCPICNSPRSMEREGDGICYECAFQAPIEEFTLITALASRRDLIDRKGLKEVKIKEQRNLAP